MRFWSFAVEVGTAGIRITSSEQIAFHNSVARLIGETQEVSRLGATNSLTVSHQEAVHDAAVLPQRLIAALTTPQPRKLAFADLLILDFSANPFFVLREPLLFVLATGMADVCIAGLCCRFAILLPKLPGSDGAFRRKLGHFSALVNDADYQISIIDAGGVAATYSRTGESKESLAPGYVEAVKTLHGDDQTRLDRKCVRRLGHFPAHPTDIRKSKCRHFSYYLHDCGNELTRLFRTWYSDNDFARNPILYDLRGNDLLREVVIAHGERNNLKVERVVDVLDSQALGEEIRSGEPAIVVVDVVDSGMTLGRHVHELTTRGIPVSPKVLAGVNKRGTNDSQFDNPKLSVHGLLARPAEVIPTTCAQCALHLPFTSDAGEELIRLRSYDVLFMISNTGWTAEPATEVPDNIGLPYNVIPNFAAILEEFGDWIAFKLYNALRDRGLPDDWFVIHPEEGDSSALSRKLYDCVAEELPIVRIPRERIKEAQRNAGDWASVVEAFASEDWVEQLRNMHHAGALVIDIFNGSGSTSNAIVSLLRHFDLMPMCYACVVDFAPTPQAVIAVDVPKLALYEWDSPRDLKDKR